MLWRHIAKASEQPPADAWQCTYRHTVQAWVGAALSCVVTCLISLCCCMQVCMKGKLQPALSISTTFLWESGQGVSPKAHVANWVICLLRLLHGSHYSATWKLVRLPKIHKYTFLSLLVNRNNILYSISTYFSACLLNTTGKNWLTFSHRPPIFILLLNSSGNCSDFLGQSQRRTFFFICKSSTVPLGHSHQCTAMVKQLLTMAHNPPSLLHSQRYQNLKTPNNDVKTNMPEREANFQLLSGKGIWKSLSRMHHRDSPTSSSQSEIW